MKLMSFILSITILALSIMPCKDTNAIAGHPTLVFTQSNGTSECAHDHCSPFCFCNCCSTVNTAEAATPLFQITALATITLKKDYPIRKVAFSSYFFGNIWQPPKRLIAA